MRSIFGLLVLIVDIYAIVKIVQSRAGPEDHLDSRGVGFSGYRRGGLVLRRSGGKAALVLSGQSLTEAWQQR
jgi:hypothetical protein